MEKKKVPVRLFKKTDASAEYEVPVEADVVRWFKKEGDTVQKGNELVELEADKGNFSIDAPESGKLVDIRYALRPNEVRVWKRGKPEKVGDTLFYDPPLCFIEVEEALPAPQETAPENRAKPKVSAEALRVIQGLGLNLNQVLEFSKGKPRIDRADVMDYFTRLEGTKGGIEPQPPRGDATIDTQKVVPAARERARELGIDLSRIQGTGPNGEILVSDVEAHSPTGAKSQETIRLAVPRLWRTIAKNMKAGMRIPTADADTRLDFTRLLEFHKANRQRFPMALWFPLVLALTRVLAKEEFRIFNAYWDDSNGESPVVIRKAVHMGLAFDRGETPRINLESGRIEGERLKILVLKNAEKKTLAELASETRNLLNMSLTGRVPLEVLSGYTFIFNNIGGLGHERGRSLLSGEIAAMVNFCRIDPQTKSGILQIVFDHRLIDGAQTLAFLRAAYHELVEHVIPELDVLLRK